MTQISGKNNVVTSDSVNPLKNILFVACLMKQVLFDTGLALKLIKYTTTCRYSAKFSGRYKKFAVIAALDQSGERKAPRRTVRPIGF